LIYGKSWGLGCKKGNFMLASLWENTREEQIRKRQSTWKKGDIMKTRLPINKSYIGKK